MKPRISLARLCVFAAGLAAFAAWADDAPPLPRNPSFTTLVKTPLAIEGLTGDAAHNLYTTGRAAVPNRCPVWRIDTTATAPALIQVGSIPNAPTACNPSGITFDAFGNLYVADANLGGVVWKLTADGAGGFTSPASNTDTFASGVPGTNGIAFDRDGNLWTGDGTTGQGRVWRVAAGGGNCEPNFVGCVEAFRVQPMANSKNVGRQASTLQPVAAANPQPLVANGVAFNHEGDLLIADTARGALWRVQLDRDGKPRSRTGCDTTFTSNTLCLDNIFVEHSFLEGTDGIALDRAGNIWNSANERNAIVVVSKDGRVTEVFRNPVNSAGLRNSADTAEGNRHILELPTSPFLLGSLFCTANSDGDRRDNSPRAAGEINAGNASAVDRGKISCMDQRLKIPGLPLPVH